MEETIDFDLFLTDCNKPSFKNIPTEVKFVMFGYLPICKIVQMQMLNRESYDTQTKNETFKKFIKHKLLTCPWEGLSMTDPNFIDNSIAN
jgi:hypothetical protein